MVSGADTPRGTATPRRAGRLLGYLGGAIISFALVDRPVLDALGVVVAVSAPGAVSVRVPGVPGGPQAVLNGRRLDLPLRKGVVQASGWPPRLVWALIVLLVFLDVLVFLEWT
ncbi:MAG: hypothetical protein LH645_03220 [Actinomycetia bacterium]|nr:hypothetical protein [Actinomycetes bacterium]